jgi:hypothetical protein
LFLDIATYALVTVGLFAGVDLCTLAAVMLESANVTLLLGRDVRRAALTAVTILELAVGCTAPRLICGHHCRKEQYNPRASILCVRFCVSILLKYNQSGGWHRRRFVGPPKSVAPAHLSSPGNQQTPPPRRGVASHSVRGHRPLLHVRHSVEYSHPRVRLSAALGKPIVHLWVLAFSYELVRASRTRLCAFRYPGPRPGG